jgi:hypothetical protein
VDPHTQNPSTLFDLKNFFRPCLVLLFHCAATDLSDLQSVMQLAHKRVVPNCCNAVSALLQQCLRLHLLRKELFSIAY